MNVASNASFAFLIVSMLACSFAIYRKRTRSRKMGGDAYPILPTTIIFLNMIISVVIAFVHLMWVNSSPSRFIIAVYLVTANVFVLALALPLPKVQRVDTKYMVQRIIGSGWGSVTVSEQDYQDRAIYDAYQLAKKNTNAVFVVIDTRGKHIATVNHSDVSVQMHDPNGAF